MVLLVVATLALSSCWWTQPGRDGRHSGYNSGETTVSPANAPSLTEAWSVDLGDGPVRDPAISVDGVHAVSGFRLDTRRLADGTERWATRVLPPECPEVGCEFAAAVGSPSVYDGNVLVPAFVGQGTTPSLGNAANVFEGSTGARLDPLPAGVGTNSVTVDGNLLAATSQAYCGQCFIATLAVFDPTDPSRDWRVLLTQTRSATAPAVGPYDVVFGIGGSVVSYAVTAPTTCDPAYPLLCSPHWSYDTEGDPGPPVFDDGGVFVYVGDSAGRVYLLAGWDGHVIWSGTVRGTGAQVVAPPTVAGGLLYVPSTNGRITVFDADGCGTPTCAPLWSGSTGSPITKQAALANGVLYVASDDGSIDAFDADGCGSSACNPIWSTTTGSPITGAPAVASGNLVVGTADGRLIAYRPS